MNTIHRDELADVIRDNAKQAGFSSATTEKVVAKGCEVDFIAYGVTTAVIDDLKLTVGSDDSTDELRKRQEAAKSPKCGCPLQEAFGGTNPTVADDPDFRKESPSQADVFMARFDNTMTDRFAWRSGAILVTR